MNSERLPRLIDAIYDAAADPANWEQALTLLRDHFGGTNAAVTITDTSPLKLESRVSVGIDPQYAASYASYYASKNPIWLRAPVCPPPGTVLTNWMVMDTTEVTKTEFYNDWVRPQGFHGTLACYVLKEGAASGVVSVAREVGKGEFERDEVDAFAHTIAPHLRRAAQMQVRLMRAELHRAGSIEAMDRLEDGVFLLGADGRVLHTNCAAQELLREGDGLRPGRDGLHAAHNGDTAAPHCRRGRQQARDVGSRRATRDPPARAAPAPDRGRRANPGRARMAGARAATLCRIRYRSHPASEAKPRRLAQALRPDPGRGRGCARGLPRARPQGGVGGARHTLEHHPHPFAARIQEN